MADNRDLILRNREGIRAIATQAREYQTEIAACKDEFERGLLVAEAMSELRAALTPELMKPIMALQGSPLGFVTDKDKSGGYDERTVRDCTVEAWLRGFYHVNNELNIISGRFYGAKAGFERLVRKFPGVTNFEMHMGVPEVVNGNALVQVVASWSLNGHPDKLERTKKRLSDGGEIDLRVPVRVNAGMGTDAILGKVQRKVYAEIYQRLSGEIIPEGEVSDVALDAQFTDPKVKRSSLFDNTPAQDPDGPSDDQDAISMEYQVAFESANDKDRVREIVAKASKDSRLKAETKALVMDMASKTHKRIAGR